MIAYLDDSAMMHGYIQRHLGKAGFEVDIWYPISAAELPDRIRSRRPDLVLTDYAMPGCNGATVARLVRSIDPDLPVIVLTALRDDDLEQSLRKFGVRQVLTKPIDGPTLVEAIQVTLGIA